LSHPRDFRDQSRVFPTLCCIEKVFGKNMARILRGLNGIFVRMRWGGCPFPFPFVPSSCGPPVSLWALFRPVGWGKFSDLQFLAFLGLCFGLYCVIFCKMINYIAVGLLWACGAFLRLLFFLPACRVHLYGAKGRFYLFLCLFAWSVCPCVLLSFVAL